MSIACSASAGQINVAVSSNFTAPMQIISRQFEQETGHKVLLAFGSTGKFYAQIRNGAPFEVLLAADAATPERIATEGLGVAESRFTYAVGTLVLWSITSDQPLKALQQNSFNRIAMADPKLAPYGSAARQTLQKLGLYEHVKGKMVTGENISQTYQFVATANAELGFVALSQVFVDGKLRSGSAWVVPESEHDPIRQDAILLNPGKQNVAAGQFMAFLKSDKARKVIASYGYRF